MVARLSQYDKDNLERILRDGMGDWFSAELMRLIAKADFDNKARLRLSFPDHVQAYDNYMNGVGVEMTPQQVARAIFAGSERMGVDLRSTLDISDEVFDALTKLASFK